MNKFNLIWIIALFLIALPLAYSATGSGCVILNQSFDGGAVANFSVSGASVTDGHLIVGDGQYALFVHAIPCLNLSSNTNNCTLILYNYSVTYNGNFYQSWWIMSRNVTTLGDGDRKYAFFRDGT